LVTFNDLTIHNLEEAMKVEFPRSSNIASATYDADTEVLEIEFKRSGSVYRYFAVPQRLFEGLEKAASAGQYFSERIRDKFRTVQIK
jgi:hypothetical protein